VVDEKICKIAAFRYVPVSPHFESRHYHFTLTTQHGVGMRMKVAVAG
jgi:hypothetical protein